MPSLIKPYLLGIQIRVKPTSKAYRSTLTIKESIHVKFEESNTFVRNVVEIDSLGEDMERITLRTHL